jgi:hypothetical protein
MPICFERKITVVANGECCYKSCPCLIGIGSKRPVCGFTDEGLVKLTKGPNAGRAIRTLDCLNDELKAKQEGALKCFP